MSEIGEAIGTVVEGAAYARTLEPAHGEGDGHTREGFCLNCGTVLVGAHCHVCGQRAHIHRTLRAFGHDLLHGVLHFEGKTWRTLPLLAWHPGRLTREYIDGKRASYVSPIALFLFVVFLSFALFSMLGGSQSIESDVGLEQAKSAYEANEQQLAELRGARKAQADAPTRLAEIDEKIAGLEDDQEALGMVVGNVGSEFEKDFKAGFERNPLPEGNELTRLIKKIKENPALTVYKVQTNAYKYSWMLIPLSVPFVWLLFPFSRRFGAYDHTVFVTYSITFMIALVAAASLLGYFGYAEFGLVLAATYAPFHMYRQLRETYALGRWGALWRTMILGTCAWVAIGLFAAMITVMAGG